MNGGTVRLMQYLGVGAAELLAVPPFSQWAVARSVESDSPKVEIHYEFPEHGVDVICSDDERVLTIFLYRGGDGEGLWEIPFSLGRRDVLMRYGSPSKSGVAVRIPALGESGPWDRFTLPSGSIHIQYCLDRDEINQVTLMRPDAVPE